MARLERNASREATLYLTPDEVDQIQDADPGDVITSGWNGGLAFRVRLAIEEVEDLPDWWGGS
jgi:hypothetical protein